MSQTGSQTGDHADRLLVIVPAFREELALPVTVNDLRENRPDADILVVDDGSPDNTTQVAKSLGCKVVTLPHNLGIGGAVQTGLMYAARHGYEIAIQFDADGQHLAGEIEKIVSLVGDGHAHVAIGSRFLSTGGFRSTFMTAVRHPFVPVRDIISGHPPQDHRLDFRVPGIQSKGHSLPCSRLPV